jgi:hypothetical protein
MVADHFWPQIGLVRHSRNQAIDHAYKAWLWPVPHSGANRGNPRGRRRYRDRYRYRFGVDPNPEVHWFIMISNADTDCDPDSDPDSEDFSILLREFNGTHGSPERHSLSGSHGQRPWF